MGRTNVLRKKAGNEFQGGLGLCPHQVLIYTNFMLTLLPRNKKEKWTLYHVNQQDSAITARPLYWIIYIQIYVMKKK